jgi:hypothetical protein
MMNGTGPNRLFQLKDVFSVENDLVILGDMVMEGDIQGPLVVDQWVAGGEILTSTGPSVVYEGTTDVHPPNGTCSVLLMDDDGDSSSGLPDDEGRFRVSILADNETDPEETISLTLTDLHGTATVGGNRSFSLRVDADPPRLENPIPESDDWICTNSVTVAIIANDKGTSGIDVPTLEYSFNGPSGPVDWRHGSVLVRDGGAIVESTTSLALPDGSGYWIRWRAMDRVGNGYVFTDEMPIRIDTRNLTFANPFPDENGWQNSTPVNCGVTMRDLRGSGVDASTVQYRVSPRNVTHYGPWMDWNYYIEDSQLIVADVDLFLVEGQYNYIQWRANDVAGNGLVVSPHYRVQVDTQPVMYTAFWPTSVQNSSDVTVLAEVQKGTNGSGILEDSCMFRYRTRDGPYSRWKPAYMNRELHGGPYYIGADLEGLQDGSDNYVQFHVYDIARNEPAISPEYQILVDTTGPFISSLTPGEREIQQGPDVMISVAFEDAMTKVDPESAFLRFSRAGEGNFGTWNDLTANVSGDSVSCLFSLRFDLGNDNLIQFRISDIVGNEVITEPLTIWVNRPPVAVISTPCEGSEHLSDLRLALNASDSYDPDDQVLKYEWYLDDVLVSTDERTSLEGPFERGTHKVELRVIDKLGSSDRTEVFVEILKVEVPEATGPGPFNVGLLLLLIVILVVCTVILYQWNRSRNG